MTYRYRFISQHHASYGVARLCRVLAVKRRQGYYEWLAAQPARQERAEADDVAGIPAGESQPDGTESGTEADEHGAPPSDDRSRSRATGVATVTLSASPVCTQLMP